MKRILLTVAAALVVVGGVVALDDDSDDPPKLHRVEVPAKHGTTYRCLIADSGIWCEHDYTDWDEYGDEFIPGGDVAPPVEAS